MNTPLYCVSAVFHSPHNEYTLFFGPLKEPELEPFVSELFEDRGALDVWVFCLNPPETSQLGALFYSKQMKKQ